MPSASKLLHQNSSIELYQALCQRFNESDLVTGNWSSKDDRDLHAFFKKGVPLYPLDQRPRPRKNVTYEHHALFNLAYIAMRHDIEEKTWAMVVDWLKQGEPLNDRERLEVSNMALDRLDNEQDWYQETLHDVARCLTEVDHVLGVAQGLGAAFTGQGKAFQTRWNAFLIEHPIGPYYHQREEERALRATLATFTTTPLSRPRL